MKSLQDDQNFEFQLLSRLLESETPLGATTLVLDMGPKFGTSQASIGRKLMEMDSLGWTQRLGARGRVLTAAGRERREQLERMLRTQHHSAELVGALSGSDLKTLLDVLVARRGLERESARLAAQNAGPDEISALRASILAQEQALAEGRIPHLEDNQFHDLLTIASGNRVLQHAIQLVRSESQYSHLVALMRKRVGGQLVADHRLIVECVASRSPEGAEAAVEQHINKLIEDVRAYFRIYSGRVRE